MVVGEKERKGDVGGRNVLAAAHALDAPRRLPYLALNQRQTPHYAWCLALWLRRFLRSDLFTTLVRVPELRLAIRKFRNKPF